MCVTLCVAHFYLRLGVQSDMNPAMAGQRSPHHTPVLEMIIVPKNLQTHTHGGDILECYSKGVMSYPPHKVIWSYTLEGNTLINSSTCSQTWPSLSPTHTHIQGRAAKVQPHTFISHCPTKCNRSKNTRIHTPQKELPTERQIL